MFNPEKLTHKAQETLAQAISKAQELNHPVLEDLHLLWSLSHLDGVAQEILQKLNLKSILDPLIDSKLQNLPTSSDSSQPQISSDTAKILQLAGKLSQANSDEFISQEVLLLAAFQTTGPAQEIIQQLPLNYQQLEKEVKAMRQGQSANSPSSDQTYNVLEKYTINLTQKAREGKLDPVIGRDTEIRRVMQVLSRRTKNNPVLIGDPGVGKTAIVEGLAQRIHQGDVPESLKHKELLILDISSVLAGAKFRGEFEERLKALLRQITADPDRFIIFIDELHTIVGAGSAEGAVDASNMLKPGLARGELHIIGATTLNEYRKYIEKDAALERRFQPVFVGEPSPEDALAILRGLKEKYEVHHGVAISDEALEAAVKLSSRYISDRFLPDKAIDLLDEACSSIKIESQSKPEVIDSLNRKITQLEIEKKALQGERGNKDKIQELDRQLANLKEKAKQLETRWQSQKELLEKISQVRQDIDQLKLKLESAEREVRLDEAAKIKYGQLPEKEKELANLEKKWQQIPSEDKLIKDVVSAEDIASVVSRWTGIPANRLLHSEAEKLAHLEAELGKRVIGQKDALVAVANAIRRSRAGLSDENKPSAVFLFLGPTGVGKTETAKALAATLFDDEKAIVRIDMSEYGERHSVARLIGSPPGYVGHEEGGQLTEAIRRRPYSIVLLDEIEKAHDDVFNIFLQIFDDGRLTDGKGRTVDFRNTVIIMTSNLAGKLIQQNQGDISAIESQIWETLKQKFRPEFLNRIDQIIVFDKLSPEEVEKIVTLEIQKVEARLKENHIRLEISPKAKKQLAKLGYDPQFGARPLKRIIQSQIVDPIALKITQGEIKPNSKITIDLDSRNHFTFKHT